jgi:hypothetical protein
MPAKKLTVDKSDLFSNKIFANSGGAVSIPDNYYSLGLELEFRCPTTWYNRKYNASVHKAVNTSDYLDNYRCEYNSSLGFDGSGPATKEFRSPVFSSSSPEECFIQLKQHVIEVQQYLMECFNAKFVPYNAGRTFGVHFSTGGKFLSNSWTFDLIKRSKIIQPKLKAMLDSGEDKVLFEYRENRYSGRIPDNVKYPSDVRFGYTNAVRTNTGRVEFRYLPSADIRTILPIIEFVVLDTYEPVDNKIRYIK